MNDATIQRFRELAQVIGCGERAVFAVVIRCTYFPWRESVKGFGYTRQAAESCAKWFKNSRVVTNDEALAICKKRS